MVSLLMANNLAMRETLQYCNTSMGSEQYRNRFEYCIWVI